MMYTVTRHYLSLHYEKRGFTRARCADCCLFIILAYNVIVDGWSCIATTLQEEPVISDNMELLLAFGW